MALGAKACGLYVEIDDVDMERTHLWVSVMNADGGMVELIE